MCQSETEPTGLEDSGVDRVPSPALFLSANSAQSPLAPLGQANEGSFAPAQFPSINRPFDESSSPLAPGAIVPVEGTNFSGDVFRRPSEEGNQVASGETSVPDNVGIPNVHGNSSEFEDFPVLGGEDLQAIANIENSSVKGERPCSRVAQC